MLAFQWELCCLSLPVWRSPSAWLHSAFWCIDGRSVYVRGRLYSSNLSKQEGRKVGAKQPQLEKQVKKKTLKELKLKCILLVPKTTENNVDRELTGVLEDLLVWLDHRAETVEDQSSQLGGGAL